MNLAILGICRHHDDTCAHLDDAREADLRRTTIQRAEYAVEGWEDRRSHEHTEGYGMLATYCAPGYAALPQAFRDDHRKQLARSIRNHAVLRDDREAARRRLEGLRALASVEPVVSINMAAE